MSFFKSYSALTYIKYRIKQNSTDKSGNILTSIVGCTSPITKTASCETIVPLHSSSNIHSLMRKNMHTLHTEKKLERKIMRKWKTKIGVGILWNTLEGQSISKSIENWWSCCILWKGQFQSTKQFTIFCLRSSISSFLGHANPSIRLFKIKEWL